VTVLRAVPLLAVSDLAAATDAYVRATGMEVIMDHGWIVTVSPPQDHSIQVSLVTRDPTGPVTPVLSLEVADVDEACEVVREAGLEIVYPVTDEEWGVRRFFFRDPDGHVVNVLAHR